ncbi:diguanylate cyclase (GGDEF)-like protein [Rhizobium sp. SG_E_25_P2]|uniref:GGDEF domain-containing protein n=1 Tax=Rhizobium sp. SG_E_25_P2 TaxID=2879942 RepID=UPI0024743BA6|nr:GGDEF domain-containing protein [Rhizobium sp. SG_E_25_P2]MDH6268669.1 diguanylate cyclase (GGDEF)-like protein [Rhizobium sp. SG_E_25_P2]
MDVLNLVLLVFEACLYFGLLVCLLHWRARLGIGVMMTVLGVMHFLETYLAARFYVMTPFGMASPGSILFYSGKLVMILMIYIREDAATVRQLIYGLLGGNTICLLFAFVLRLHTGLGLAPGAMPDTDFLDQMGVLMVWGTALLYIESIGVILLYEALGRWMGRSPAPRLWLASVLALIFDQIGFYAVLRLLYDAPISVFWASLTGKCFFAFVYAVLAAFYFRFFASGAATAKRFPADVFADLTYRERYDALLARSGVDTLTGVKNRGRLEEVGPGLIQHHMETSAALSLLIADVDHFKQINDRFGHLQGDAVLRAIAEALKSGLRNDVDQLFRFGGEEFLILMPGIGHDAALRAAERLRLRVEAQVTAGGAPVSVSIGVASAPAGGDTLRALIDTADQGLYRAKANGRNQVDGVPRTA